MENLKKNGGFVRMCRFHIDESADIDSEKQMLELIPLAKPPSHNPVYASKPGEGKGKQILYDILK